MTQSQTPTSSPCRSGLLPDALIVGLLLLTWGLRLCRLETVPPGWRDDELINIHALSGELFTGRFPLYFTGASGHEPLYHYLHAIVHAVLGFNVLSGHLLSVVLGILSVALTYTLTRRLFGREIAFLASLALTTSFWSLMYSRTAIRHINLPPCALIVFYLLWRALSRKPGSSRKTWVLVGLAMGLSLYTYPAARLLPVLLILFGAYLVVIHRSQFGRCWQGILLALATTAISVAPMGIAIVQGRSEAAAQGIGADARLAELAIPLRELQSGNLRPLLETAATTLSMFHATGDPEWLYNVPDRAVFNLLGGALLWAGVTLCLCWWRRPRYFFLLLWLGLGLLPAFVSTPPASLSHTILAQPVAYVLPTLVLTEAYRGLRTRISNTEYRIPRLHSTLSLLILGSIIVVLAVFLVTNAVRDLRDYFVVWPERGMVRFLYRADYREAARYLNARADSIDVAIPSALMGPWDRLALQVDTQGHDEIRLFDPERALVWVAPDVPSRVLLTSFPRPSPLIATILEANADSASTISPYLELYELRYRSDSGSDRPLARFANGLDLLDVRAMGIDDKVADPDRWVTLLTVWRVARSLDLPPLPIVANPPPPGVRSDPRLAVFAHLLTADAAFITGDDGLWVDPLTLRPGDCFAQYHHFTLPPDVPAGQIVVRMGLYDPVSNDRWPILESSGQFSSDHLLIPLGEIGEAEEDGS
jgi:4-amino-4-deoxy-L-arabinose transferase-like glycosyltransferase